MKAIILYIFLITLSTSTLFAESKQDSTSLKAKTTGSSFELNQNYPNPFSKSTTIDFYAPLAQVIGFKVYNMIGSVVFTKDIAAEKGINYYEFERGALAPGFYFYSIQSGGSTLTKRMMIRD